MSGLLAAATAVIQAGRLPIRTYTTADGLPSNFVYRIVRDSHGFLWFCTDEGLSRFDGYSFVNFTRDQGLPSDDVSDLVETRDGSYWIATQAGVCRFNRRRLEGGKDPRFEIHKLGEDRGANQAERLLEDRAGTLWVGTHRGLWRLKPGARTFEFVNLPIRAESGSLQPNDFWVRALLEDRRGDLWIGTAGSGVYRLGKNGSTQQFAEHEGITGNPLDGGRHPWINTFFEDRTGDLWIGTRSNALYRMTMKPEPVLAGHYSWNEGLGPSGAPFVPRVRAMLVSRKGEFWIATSDGLGKLLSPWGMEPARFETYTKADGLTSINLVSFAEDNEGNLWAGCEDGAMRIAQNGLTLYRMKADLALDSPVAIFEGRAGELLALTRDYPNTKLALHRFENGRFQSVRPKLPKNDRSIGWGANQVALKDHAGEWWLATGSGLIRFPAVGLMQLSRVSPKAIYTTRDGLRSDIVLQAFEDSRGDIWISANPPEYPTSMGAISRWSRATGKFRNYTISELATAEGATAFAEDRAGAVWIGFADGVVDRFRGGEITRVMNGEALGQHTAVHVDHTGRIWVANSQGLIRIDDPNAQKPKIMHYGTKQGLSGYAATCITDDLWGRMYVGSERGIDRLDPASGSVKHFGEADGLPRRNVWLAHRDSKGTLWFGSGAGIYRYTPELERATAPAQVRIVGLRIRGLTQTISDAGETAIGGLELGSQDNQVQIDFTGLGFSSGELRYQYMLEGADAGWNPPGDQRTVNYASLAPGRYRFLVRAVRPRGVAHSAPAVVAFRILPPLWMRWWFFMLAALAFASAVYSLYRYRVSKLLEVERIRMRIATDLHDDIGASLSQVALLSEVVRQRVNGDAGVRAPLEQIGGISRQLMESMSDIVWSINPKRDTLGDLAQRMRAFASDVLPARQVAFEFRAPGEGQEQRLSAEGRRQVYLIFKESVNNIVRHSGASAAQIEFHIEDDWLVLQVSDNGKGCNGKKPAGGHGLASMGERARQLGGQLRVDSSERGTIINLRIPT